MSDNIYLKETIKGSDSVLWVCFECENGSGAMLNLNNVVENHLGSTRHAMGKAIKEYFGRHLKKD